MTIRVLLIRHGQTFGNTLHRYIGSSDEPLCEAGIKKLMQSRHFPEVKTVYTSPLLRTRQTAELIFPNAKQICCEQLREMDFGDFDNRSPDEMADDAAYRQWVESNCLDKCPNGEDMESFSQRTCAAFCSIIDNAINTGEKELYIVAHGGSLMSIMNRFTKEDKPPFFWFADNGCGWLITLDPQEWRSSQKFSSWENFS